MSGSQGVICGWDLGGAHVKLAVLTCAGALERVVQVPCELWLGLDRLEAALLTAAAGIGAEAVHAVTMTGELADLFEDRRAGVAAIADTFRRTLRTERILVFAGSGFVPVHAAGERWADVASANWLATASLVARLLPSALVIDVGSTTTDIVVVAQGDVDAQGRDDFARLAREELVYTGVARTPVMAIAQRVPFAGEWVGVMAEYFATMADVYRITGELDLAFDQHRTADGRGKSKEESMRRLMRMIGLDFEPAVAQDCEHLARWVAQAQRGLVRRGCDRQLSRGLLDSQAPVVGLGVGAFLAAQLAGELGRDYRDFATVAGVAPEQRDAVDVCGPAFAVARLLSADSRARE
jgi:probable H4MPT-linked C1 transfer pathway protein